MVKAIALESDIKPPFFFRVFDVVELKGYLQMLCIFLFPFIVPYLLTDICVQEAGSVVQSPY